MASRLFNPFLCQRGLFAAGLGVSTAVFGTQLLHSYRTRYALRMDSSPVSTSPKDWSFSQYQNDAQTPIVQRQGGLNARAVRQMSSGSIIGLIAGLGLSLFSKPLVVLIGLFVAGVQTAESYGIHLIPYRQMQRYVKGVDLRSAVQDNAAFKISFGLIFALSAFAQF